MSEMEKRCPNCGAVNGENATFCRHCYASLIRGETVVGETLEGINKSDWHDFIDNNASYYVDTFSQNEGKKVFFRMNWSAFFFGSNWMLYRKMYLYAIIFLVANLLLSFCLATVVLTAYRPTIDEMNRTIQPYEQYMINSGTSGMLAAGTDGTVDVNEVLDAMQQYQEQKSSLLFRISFWLIVPFIVLQVAFGLLANCLYRYYVRRHIAVSQGGTSVWSAILGVVAYRIAEAVLISPLISALVTSILV